MYCTVHCVHSFQRIWKSHIHKNRETKLTLTVRQRCKVARISLLLGCFIFNKKNMWKWSSIAKVQKKKINKNKSTSLLLCSQCIQLLYQAGVDKITSSKVRLWSSNSEARSDMCPRNGATRESRRLWIENRRVRVVMEVVSVNQWKSVETVY